MSVSNEIVARPRRSNPTSARCEAPRLRSNRPATTSSTAVSATWLTTSASRMRSAGADLAGRCFAAQIADQARRRRLERRQQARQHAGDRRDDDREGQHARVDAQIERDIDRQRQLDALQRLHERPRQRHGRDRAQRAEQRAFDQQLLNQPAAAGADREPHADLAAPRGCARQQHARRRWRRRSAAPGRRPSSARRRRSTGCRRPAAPAAAPPRSARAAIWRSLLVCTFAASSCRPIKATLAWACSAVTPGLSRPFTNIHRDAAPFEARPADRRRHRVVDAGGLDLIDVLNRAAITPASAAARRR